MGTSKNEGWDRARQPGPITQGRQLFIQHWTRAFPLQLFPTSSREEKKFCWRWCFTATCWIQQYFPRRKEKHFSSVATLKAVFLLLYFSLCFNYSFILSVEFEGVFEIFWIITLKKKIKKKKKKRKPNYTERKCFLGFSGPSFTPPLSGSGIPAGMGDPHSLAGCSSPSPALSPQIALFLLGLGPALHICQEQALEEMWLWRCWKAPLRLYF